MFTPSSCPGNASAWFDESFHPTLCIFDLPIPAMVLPVVIGFLFIFFKSLEKRGVYLKPPFLSKHNLELRDPRENNLPTELLRIAAVVSSVTASYFAASYLTTCIGWRRLFWSAPAVPPTLDGSGFFGGVLLEIIWALMAVPALIRGDKRRSQRKPMATLVFELVFAAEAVGWTMILELGMWSLIVTGWASKFLSMIGI